MGKRACLGLCLLCLSCASSRAVVPARTAPVFSPALADPAAKAQLTALVPQLDAYLQERFAASGATGVAVGIVLQGELIYEKNMGVLARGSSVAVNGDSVFRVASLSKSFTALAVMKLRDEGRLSLDVPIAEYLPELRELRGVPQDAAPITARLLLTHASGLPWDDTWGAVSFGFHEVELEELLRHGVSFAREPGSAFEYSNLGFALLGRLVARVSGVSFEQYLTQHILHPLGMTSTAWRASAVPAERLAIGYWGDHEPLAEAPRVGDGVFEPAGGMYTSLHDYARYLSFQLSAYPARDAPEQGPVRRSTLRETHRAQRIAAASDHDEPIAQRTDDGVALHQSSYGFGWFNETSCNDRERLEHGGWEPGYIAGVIVLPAQRIAVVTMATTKPVRAAEGLLNLLRDAHALPAATEPDPSADLVAAGRAVNKLLEHWDASLVQQAIDPRSVHYPWYSRAQSELPKLASQHGRCLPEGPVRANDRLSGSWNMRCERGSLRFKVDLTPAVPALIHLLRWTSQLPPDERMSSRAAQLTAAIGGTHEALADLLAPGVDVERVHRRLAHAAIDHGTCLVDRPIAGNGHTEASFLLACKSAPGELAIELDEARGQVVSLDLHRPRDPSGACWQ